MNGELIALISADGAVEFLCTEGEWKAADAGFMSTVRVHVMHGGSINRVPADTQVGTRFAVECAKQCSRCDRFRLVDGTCARCGFVPEQGET